MKEIKLTIDGKEIQLTDEQLKMLLVEKEEKRKTHLRSQGSLRIIILQMNAVLVNIFITTRMIMTTGNCAM